MKKFEEIRRYEPYRRYEKLKIYVFSTDEVFECFDEFFNTEYFQERFYSNLDCSYSASDVINLSPDAKDEVYQTTADNTIDDLVGCQDILIIKEQDILITKEFEGR